MGVLDTILVFTVYSLNFLLFFGAACTLYITMSEGRQKDIEENFDLDLEYLLLFSKFMLYIAVIVALISFLGCFGIAIDNDYMLMAYVSVVVLMMIVKIILLVYVAKNVDLSHDEARQKIIRLIQESAQDQTSTMDTIQNKNNCCGFESYNDWLKSPRGTIPGSCCKKPPTEQCTSISVAGKPGCNAIISEKIKNIITGLYKVIAFVFALETLLVVATILILLDIGQSIDESFIDVVHIGQLKEGAIKDQNSKFEESIDTHDITRAKLSEGEVIYNKGMEPKDDS